MCDFVPGEEVICVDANPCYSSGRSLGLIQDKLYIVEKISFDGIVVEYGPWVRVYGLEDFVSHRRFRRLRYDEDSNINMDVETKTPKVKVPEEVLSILLAYDPSSSDL